MAYDSREDTQQHIDRVRELLYEVESRLWDRGFRHDASKLVDPEKSMFDAATEKLRTLTYGTDEYKQSLKDLGPALIHHYVNNSHHPEHYCFMTAESDGGLSHTLLDECVSSGQGVASMSLLDVMEMLVDWKAASERHADGNIWKSIEHNTERFGLSDQLADILRNTAREMGWS